VTVQKRLFKNVKEGYVIQQKNEKALILSRGGVEGTFQCGAIDHIFIF